MRRRCCEVLAAALALCCHGRLAAQEAVEGFALGDRAARPGEVAGTGQWLTDGGGLGRNGASSNPPLLRRPAFGWRVELDGRLVGEPRVWDEHIALGLELDGGRKRVEVRRLDDGSVVGSRELESDARPDVSIWGDEVVWRAVDGRLELLRIGGSKGLDFVERMRKTGETWAPLRIGADLFVVADGKLRRLRASDFREQWAAGARCLGPVSMLDDHVYVLCEAGGGTAVAAFDARTGEERGRSVAVGLQGRADAGALLQLAGKTLVVRYGAAARLAGVRIPGAEVCGARFELPLAPGGDSGPMVLEVPHAIGPNAHVYAGRDGAGKVQLALLPTDGDGGIRLDSCDYHRELAQLAPTIVPGVVYFGACAVALEDRRVLWHMAKAGGFEIPRSRAIPAGRHLLFFDEGQLLALRADAPVDAVAAELQQALRAAERERLEPLVLEAKRVRDWDLAETLLARCRALGADEAWAGRQDKSIQNGRRRRQVKPDADDCAEVAADAARVPEAAVAAVRAAVSEWGGAREAVDHRRALRFLLERDPDDAALHAQVRAMLPEDVVATEPFQALDWLDYLGAVETTEVRWLDASKEEFEAGGLDPVEAQCKAQLLEWRDRWRQDLRALRSERVLMFSPIGAPGSLAKAQATGEIVCDLLESMFAHMPKARQDRRPMTVFIYPDRADYLAESEKLGVGLATMAAGYYSWNERPAKSRLYVPADDAGFQSVLPTLAHELTHHWLMDRCEAFQPNIAATLTGPRAFWIVEGFASLVEQFEFDFERRTFVLGRGGDLSRADMVASLGEGQYLPWQGLVQASRAGFAAITKDEQRIDVPSRSRLGRTMPIRLVDLFYAQSAMLARYLYEAEDGRYRQQLLDYVVAYYSGDQAGLDFDKAFGVGADELGPKVFAFSRSLVE